MIGGVLGGITGAVAFAAIAGAGSIVRWLIILALGGILGLVFAALPYVARWASHSLFAGIGLGILWGIVWWVPGLLVYPRQSIAGFVAWGAFLGAVYDITRRVAASSERRA